NMINFRSQIFILGNDTFSKCYRWDGVAATVANAGFTGLGLNIRTVGVYKKRRYFGSASSLVVYYGAVDAITGACASFDVQSICSRGGYT
ncbi:hypothetical protein LAJ55_13795, partial [Streptococcus pneumoniae]|uniref:hypothetical protein n=1 Tax=Streptococcus pneumoniae TaxID=1313 RepID=UPI001CBBC4DB